MSDDQRYAILDEARDTLDRLADFNVEHRGDIDLAADDLDLARRRDLQPPANPPTAPPARPVRSATDINRQRTADWEKWLRRYLDFERRLARDVVAHVVAAERERHSDEIKRLENMIGALATEIATIKREPTKEYANLLNVLERPRHDD